MKTTTHFDLWKLVVSCMKHGRHFLKKENIMA